uniref:Uncharacterized protein n=1 Tax=Macaca fascicularis TaxID=9541 RepID=A0A7N9DAW5_MACFA
MVAGKRMCTGAGELPFIKPSDLMRLIHYPENSMEKTCPHDSVTFHQVPPMARGDYESYNARGNLVGDTAELYPCSSHPQNVSSVSFIHTSSFFCFYDAL